jgi:tripartite-type tricarboxylate transporter receptor subunit TctC
MHFRASVMPLARRAFVLAGLAMVAGGALAQAYPDRPITMIVPWGAGGGTDAVARMLASLPPSPPRRPTATPSG